MGNKTNWAWVALGTCWIGGCSVDLCEDRETTKNSIAPGHYTATDGHEFILGEGRNLSEVPFPHASYKHGDCAEQTPDDHAAGGQGGAGGLGNDADAPEDRCSGELEATSLKFERGAHELERSFTNKTGKNVVESWAIEKSISVSSDTLLGCDTLESEVLTLTLKSLTEDGVVVESRDAYAGYQVSMEWSNENDEEGALFSVRLQEEDSTQEFVYGYSEWYPEKLVR